ncbi:MAG: efflux RND transporter periplasmic adaptor subunit, partial [Algiphilus sp.]
ELVVVPRTAVKYNSYGSSVFIVQEDPDKGPPPENPNPNMPPHTELMVKQRFVQLGEARGDFVEVLDGLQGGEEIATTGLLKLRNEMPVIINNEGAPEPKLDPAVPEG